MPIEIVAGAVVCDGVCTVEDAVTLRDWARDRRATVVDLSGAEHLHTAVVQVLLAMSSIHLSALPEDPLLRKVLAGRPGGLEAPRPYADAIQTAA